MFSLNMKDADFKGTIRDYFQRECCTVFDKLPFKPDYLLEHDGASYFFEYENSSRGLVHNLTKIAQYHHSLKERTSFIVYLIRTKNHQEKHNLDYNRACFLASQLSNFYLEFRIVNEQDFWNEIEPLMLEVEAEDITIENVCGPCASLTSLEEFLEGEFCEDF